VSSVDRILEAIDVGLQRESGADYAASVGDPSMCARCQRHEPSDGEMCSGCRAFLLGDSDEDPARRRVWMPDVTAPILPPRMDTWRAAADPPTLHETLWQARRLMPRQRPIRIRMHPETRREMQQRDPRWRPPDAGLDPYTVPAWSAFGIPLVVDRELATGVIEIDYDDLPPQRGDR
jgi:hypothetical protein